MRLLILLILSGLFAEVPEDCGIIKAGELSGRTILMSCNFDYSYTVLVSAPSGSYKVIESHIRKEAVIVDGYFLTGWKYVVVVCSLSVR